MSEESPDIPGDESTEEQRRQHVRVELSRRCAVRLRGQTTMGCELLDLSGTGCSFRIKSLVHIGDKGTIRISFDDWTLDTEITARFVQEENPLQYVVGASFDSLLRAEIDQIVKEVFTELRTQIRSQRIVE